MKLLTYLIYTLLITCFLACGPKPSHKRKMEWKKHKLEQRHSIRNYHPDSLVKYRDKRVAMRKNTIIKICLVEIRTLKIKKLWQKKNKNYQEESKEEQIEE